MKQAVFYAEAQQNPFQRDLSDRTRYFEQRDSLLRHLGIVPRLLRSADVLEFGPGHGENALYLLQQAPRRMVLVEISDECAQACDRLLSAHRPADTQLDVVRGSAETFESSEPFDLVVFEGVIPFEPDPPALLRRAGEFVAPGGLLSVTCIDSVSLFSEALRRLIGLLVAPPSLSVSERVERLTPLFEPHLETLAGMTRSAEDWVLDQMIHPWSGRPMSILEAARCLSPDFDLYGSSPAFLTDWRWFRDVHGERGYLQLAEQAYLSNVHNLLDYRFARDPRDPSDNALLLRTCGQVMDSVRDLERLPVEALDRRARILDGVEHYVKELELDLASWAPQTAASLSDYGALLAEHRAGRTPTNFGRFASLFGRGQQYVSFLRARPCAVEDRRKGA